MPVSRMLLASAYYELWRLAQAFHLIDRRSEQSDSRRRPAGGGATTSRRRTGRLLSRCLAAARPPAGGRGDDALSSSLLLSGAPGCPDHRAATATAPSPGQRPRPAPAEPSYKDLKYPALRPVQIPKVETFYASQRHEGFLLEDHELPIVNGTALVRTGNLFDPPDKVGLATMTGMVMRTGGTKTKTGEQLDQQLEDIAASVESGIGETSGSVSFSSLKENAPDVMAAFKDVMTAPEFRQDKIDLAKSQLAAAFARRNDDVRVGGSGASSPICVYGDDTPYGWEDRAMPRSNDLARRPGGFYQRYFFPENVMLAVWGDFDSAPDEGASREAVRGLDGGTAPGAHHFRKSTVKDPAAAYTLPLRRM